ncbi:hypothetical protein [Flavobacterium sp.]|uniref:hypothetical protein n=1 Tax=Flavobacterium sp. TaxID=239 RepID=UPI0025C3649E|nr:hypothetical protein [Flavobacterium sp.]MBA4154487.1 hypothetical protein [Flavobacterium sp.]
METSTTLIGLFLILLTALPIFLLLRTQHKNKSKIETILKQFNQGNSKEFSLRESLNNKVIAFNEMKKKLVLIDLNVKPEIVTYVDLNEISNSKIIREIEHFDGSKSKKEFITKVEIMLHNNKNQKDETLKFYDYEYEKPIQLNYFRDNQLAEKWLEIINKTI